MARNRARTRKSPARTGWRRWLLLAAIVSLAATAPWLTDGFWRWRYPYGFRPLIEQTAATFQIDPLLVAAVVREESRFDPLAVSGAGARGLMQMMPTTAAWVARQQGLAEPSSDALHEPAVNLRLGCWYLRYLIHRHRDLAEALAAYNGGEGNVAKWREAGSGIPFPETRSFVARSLQTYERYRRLYGDARSAVSDQGYTPAPATF